VLHGGSEYQVTIEEALKKTSENEAGKLTVFFYKGYSKLTF